MSKTAEKLGQDQAAGVTVVRSPLRDLLRTDEAILAFAQGYSGQKEREAEARGYEQGARDRTKQLADACEQRGMVGIADFVRALPITPEKEREHGEWLDRPERALHVMEAISRKDAERLLRVARAAKHLLPYAEWYINEGKHVHPTLPSATAALRAALADEDQP